MIALHRDGAADDVRKHHGRDHLVVRSELPLRDTVVGEQHLLRVRYRHHRLKTTTALSTPLVAASGRNPSPVHTVVSMVMLSGHRLVVNRFAEGGRGRVLVGLVSLALISTHASAQAPAKRPVRRQPVTPELERSAFRDDRARTLLERARAARLAQDSALGAYDANTYLRMSVGLGVRRLGVERLFFRTEQSARVRWARATGLWVQVTGRRSAFPMGHADVDFAPATPIPFFPGRESLWLPGGGVAQAEVDENELLHPLALGAEAYYRYATGDSAAIRLADGRVIALRELRITARRPEWRAFVGSFWFDVDRGSLVRAAYRMAVEMDVWEIAKDENKRHIEELEAKLLSDSTPGIDSLRNELKGAGVARRVSAS